MNSGEADYVHEEIFFFVADKQIQWVADQRVCFHLDAKS